VIRSVSPQRSKNRMTIFSSSVFVTAVCYNCDSYFTYFFQMQFTSSSLMLPRLLFLAPKNSCLHRCKALSSNLPESVKPSHSKESTQKNNLFVNHKLEELSRPRLTRCALQSCQPPDRRLTCTPDTVNAPKTQASLRSPVSNSRSTREREAHCQPAAHV